MSAESAMQRGQASVETLLEALPYIREFHGRTVVIKYGGAAMTNEVLRDEFANDVVLLKYVGLNPVIVHGGGPDITSYMERLGMEVRFVEGMRVSSDFIPVVASAGADREGNSYNINADTAAGRVAAALGAHKAIFLTDVAGWLADAEDPASLISRASVDEVERALASVAGGMRPKLSACVEAIRGGVQSAHVIDGRRPHSLLLELFTDAGIGTMVTP